MDEKYVSTKFKLKKNKKGRARSMKGTHSIGWEQR